MNNEVPIVHNELENFPYNYIIFIEFYIVSVSEFGTIFKKFQHENYYIIFFINFENFSIFLKN
jgi:hypothetical protein